MLEKFLLKNKLRRTKICEYCKRWCSIFPLAISYIMVCMYVCVSLALTTNIEFVFLYKVCPESQCLSSFSSTALDFFFFFLSCANNIPKGDNETSEQRNEEKSSKEAQANLADSVFLVFFFFSFSPTFFILFFGFFQNFNLIFSSFFSNFCLSFFYSISFFLFYFFFLLLFPFFFFLFFTYFQISKFIFSSFYFYLFFPPFFILFSFSYSSFFHAHKIIRYNVSVTRCLFKRKKKKHWLCKAMQMTYYYCI